MPSLRSSAHQHSQEEGLSIGGGGSVLAPAATITDAFVSDSLASAFSSLDRILLGEWSSAPSTDASQSTGSLDCRASGSRSARFAPPPGQGRAETGESQGIARAELVPREAPALRAAPRRSEQAHDGNPPLTLCRPLAGGRTLDEMRQRSKEMEKRRVAVLKTRCEEGSSLMLEAMTSGQACDSEHEQLLATEPEHTAKRALGNSASQEGVQDGQDEQISMTDSTGQAQQALVHTIDAAGVPVATDPQYGLPTASNPGSEASTPSKKRTYEWAAKRDRRIARRRKEPPMTRRRSQRAEKESHPVNESPVQTDIRNKEIGRSSTAAHQVLQERTSQTSNEPVTSDITSSNDRSSNISGIAEKEKEAAWKCANTQELTDPSFGDEQEGAQEEEQALPLQPIAAKRPSAAERPATRRRGAKAAAPPPLVAKAQLDVGPTATPLPCADASVNAVEDGRIGPLRAATRAEEVLVGEASRGMSETESETSTDESDAPRDRHIGEDYRGASSRARTSEAAKSANIVNGAARIQDDEESETEDEDASRTTEVPPKPTIIGTILLSPPSSQVGKMGRRFLFEPSPSSSRTRAEGAPVNSLTLPDGRENWTTNWRGTDYRKKQKRTRASASGQMAREEGDEGEVRVSTKRRRLPKGGATEKNPTVAARSSRASRGTAPEAISTASSSAPINTKDTVKASKKKGKCPVAPAGLPLFVNQTFLVVGFWGNVARYKRLIIKHGGALYDAQHEQKEKRKVSHIVGCLASEKRASKSDVKGWIEEIVKTLDLDKEQKGAPEAFKGWKKAHKVDFIESAWISDCIANCLSSQELPPTTKHNVDLTVLGD
ncbi:hypothetical protein FA10DRAFT_142151 [Acaromyces ingoldii]|uniref:BRCT domain-containing protein n=1 Tax=Acaromyces ingoldii TaxID=215250 RepID=A0A316YMP0_9BASI|nr:hypothetical protein FA10DRAFT_142151 [Acaromyces ingoldii]PWN89333.1 hypothetical protein FA10DRAFT_142151 [Acaromyces ingoldii]